MGEEVRKRRSMSLSSTRRIVSLKRAGAVVDLLGRHCQPSGWDWAQSWLELLAEGLAWLLSKKPRSSFGKRGP